MIGLSRDVAPRLLAGLLVVGGLAAMLWSGLLSTRYHSVLDPRSPCLQHGLCDPAVVAEDLRGLWLRTGLAAVLVLAGVAVAVLVRSRSVPVTGAAAPPSRRRDAAAGLVAAGVLVLGALPLGLAALAATHLGVAALAWMAVSQTWVLDWYAAQRPPLAGRARLRLGAAFLGSAAGLAAASALVAAGGAVQYGAEARLAVLAVAGVVVDGLVVAATMLAAAALARRSVPAADVDGDADGDADGGAGPAAPARTRVDA